MLFAIATNNPPLQASWEIKECEVKAKKFTLLILLNTLLILLKYFFSEKGFR